MRPAAAPLPAIRRLVIDAQGYAARGRRGTTAEVEVAVHRLSCVQLDSISAVERSHRIVLGSRVGWGDRIVGRADLKFEATER